jgi:hypothetical protein
MTLRPMGYRPGGRTQRCAGVDALCGLPAIACDRRVRKIGDRRMRCEACRKEQQRRAMRQYERDHYQPRKLTPASDSRTELRSADFARLDAELARQGITSRWCGQVADAHMFACGRGGTPLACMEATDCGRRVAPKRQR